LHSSLNYPTCLGIPNPHTAVILDKSTQLEKLDHQLQLISTFQTPHTYFVIQIFKYFF